MKAVALLAALVLLPVAPAGYSQRIDKRAVDARKERVSRALNAYPEVRTLLLATEQRALRAEAAQMEAEREAQRTRCLLVVVGCLGLLLGGLMTAAGASFQQRRFGGRWRGPLGLASTTDLPAAANREIERED